MCTPDINETVDKVTYHPDDFPPYDLHATSVTYIITIFKSKLSTNEFARTLRFASRAQNNVNTQNEWAHKFRVSGKNMRLFARTPNAHTHVSNTARAHFYTHKIYIIQSGQFHPARRREVVLCVARNTRNRLLVFPHAYTHERTSAVYIGHSLQLGKTEMHV